MYTVIHSYIAYMYATQYIHIYHTHTHHYCEAQQAITIAQKSYVRLLYHIALHFVLYIE